ncbi:hypothetical protein Asch01_01681 [Acinetobacter schindleri]|uniref:hypothetical protein n=1 Tax=Acinetobacter TaxID=469 RepID=UPI0030A37266
MSNRSNVTTSVNDAKRILTTMSVCFITMFDKKYGNVHSDVLIELMNNAIEGLLPEEIDYGLKEMCKQKFMPEFGGFRTLCEEANIWKSPEDAWNEAIQYEKMSINYINTVVKKVSDSIKRSQGDLLLQDKKYFMNRYHQEVELERKLGNRPTLYIRQNEKNYQIPDRIPCNKDEAKIHLDRIRHLIKG